jgi:DNA-binding PadR family transcriptional regulator
MDLPISTRAALLQALSVKSGYGLEIITRIRKEVGVILGQGSVYPTLTSLEKAGLVRRLKTLVPKPPSSKARASKPIKNGKSSRACIYELTRLGRRAVEQQRQIVMKVFSMAA